MIHPLTAALENIFNFILCLAFRACYNLRYIWFEWLVKLFGDYALMICCCMIIGGLLMDYLIIFAYLGIIG